MNSKVQKPPSQLCFSLPSIIITITSNELWNKETHKTDRNPPITDLKPWPFEPLLRKVLFPRRSVNMIDGSHLANVSWLLSFRVRVFLKSAVRKRHDSRGPHSYKPTIYSLSLTKTSSWDSMTWVNSLRIGIFHAHVLVVSKQGLLNTLHLSHNGLVTAVFSLT